MTITMTTTGRLPPVDTIAFTKHGVCIVFLTGERFEVSIDREVRHAVGNPESQPLVVAVGVVSAPKESP